MLRSAKRLIRRTLGLAGYQLVPIPRAQQPPAREVVNAFYRDHCFRCFAGDPQCDFILRGKGWDNQLDEILAGIDTEPGGHVIEVGANIGGSLVPRASQHPRLTFHCVEPVPEFFELLSENTRSYGVTNVQLYNEAIASTEGATITIHAQLGTAGALAQYDGHLPVGRVEMRTSTVDALFGHLDVRLLKVDTDGFELSVLRGARGILGRQRPPVFVEFHTRLMRQAGIDPMEMVALLTETGYTHMRLWDNVGTHLFDSTSVDDLVQAADRAEHYVDVLFTVSPAGEG